MWDNFVHDTVQEFQQLNNNITNNDIHIKQFKMIITTAATKYIPKGTIKKYNPNYRLEIAHLIKQRDKLKQHTNTQNTRDSRKDSNTKHRNQQQNKS